MVRFRPAPYRAALQMTGNPCDAEDLVQETMTRAYMGLQTFTPGTNARGWLRRIMASTFVSASRKRVARLRKCSGRNPMSNPQIGQRLHIFRRTVQTHLAHVFGKLQIVSRAQLAAEAARHLG